VKFVGLLRGIDLEQYRAMVAGESGRENSGISDWSSVLHSRASFSPDGRRAALKLIPGGLVVHDARNGELLEIHPMNFDAELFVRAPDDAPWFLDTSDSRTLVYDRRHNSEPEIKILGHPVWS